MLHAITINASQLWDDDAFYTPTRVLNGPVDEICVVQTYY